MRTVSTRRMYRRIEVEGGGVLAVHGSVQRIVVRDLSLNGLRMDVPFPPPRGILVAVRLWLPDDEVVEIDQALVRWSDGKQCGVQIVSLSNEMDQRLARYVESRLREEGSKLSVVSR
ncbi:MAG: PilZ domain-containing protein [Nitrospira sp.]|nr:PilZ domain-containing protein [Nitrospira sp.]